MQEKADGNISVSNIKKNLPKNIDKIFEILKKVKKPNEVNDLYNNLQTIDNIGDAIASELLMYVNKNEFALYNKKYNSIFSSIYDDEKNSIKDYQSYCNKIKKLFEFFKENSIENPNFFMCNSFLGWLLNKKDDEKIQYINILFDNINKYCKGNYIFYGAPGCGKSYFVKQKLGNTDKEHYERVLFHPEYTYSDFIGQLLPSKRYNEKTNQEDITYEFKPGPFTRILGKALQNSSDKYYLVIEEINRGNAPAIFGDIFQLLDRDKNERSEYEITNKDISECLWKDYKVELESYKVYIPENLTIYATMNLNDQNVFTLDTAFKRRWNMVYIPINFDDSEDKIGDEKITFLKNEITWKEFVEALNKIIPDLNNGLNGDDKLIGQHFLTEKEINNEELFSNKMLQYLWNDVARTDRSSLFKEEYKNFNDLVKAFRDENIGLKVFKDGIFDENNVESEINND